MMALVLIWCALALQSASKRYRSKGRGRNRSDKPHNYWHVDLPPRPNNGYDWRTEVYRYDQSKKKLVLDISDEALSLTWDDSQPTLTGTVTVQNPLDNDPLPIKEGYEVKLAWREAAGRGSWHELWRLRILDTNDDDSTGNMQLNLGDELAWLKRSTDDFVYKKGKGSAKHHRPNGWTADQITRDVCKRYGVPVGRLAKGRHLIKNMSEHTSPLGAIMKAYALDRAQTGRKFVIRMVNGKLTVTTLRRTPRLLLLGGDLLQAAVSKTLRDNFATELNVRGTAKRKKGKHKKLHALVKSHQHLSQRFGVVRRNITLSDPVDSQAQLIQRGKRQLARDQKPGRTVSVTALGIPNVRRGQAVKLQLRQDNLFQLVYVKSVSHAVDPGSYTMALTMQFTDPFTDAQGDAIRKKRCAKARKRGRHLPDECRKSFDPFAPSRNRNRGN